MSAISSLDSPLLAWMAGFEPAAAAPATPRPAARGREALDGFLQSVERRALAMLEFGTRHREEALDLLQDCMLRFVRSYAERPQAEWAPLFFRVVNNALMDWQRRRVVRERVLAWWPFGQRDRDGGDSAAEPAFPAPEHERPDIQHDRAMLAGAMHAALQRLPTRQRQVFLLREWQGLSVAETAQALAIAEGSVKAHLSRAHAKLREALSAHV